MRIDACQDDLLRGVQLKEIHELRDFDPLAEGEQLNIWSLDSLGVTN